MDFDGHFHYSSVIGKLNYLERGTRPDIAYIVHQCARFAVNPKKEHALALTWLGRYLKGMRDKGMILRPLEQSLASCRTKRTKFFHLVLFEVLYLVP